MKEIILTQTKLIILAFGSLFSGILIGWGFRGIRDKAIKRRDAKCVKDEL